MKHSRRLSLCILWLTGSDIACVIPAEATLATRAPLLTSEGTVLEACAPGRRARVACAIDGDTFDLDVCGSGERVRVLGIDAPEVGHDGAASECGADAASRALAHLEGLTVTLAFGDTCEDTFGRTLAWPWLERRDAEDLLGVELATQARAVLDDAEDAPVLLSVAFLRAGLVRRYDPAWAEPTRYDGPLADAEQQARAAGAGLWGACEDEAAP